jgi:hypothetical protein
MMLLRVASFVVGLWVVVATFLSAIRTFVLPRAVPTYLSFVVFRAVRLIFNLRARRVNSYEARDKIMAMYAPVSLLALPPVWLALVAFGYTGMFWALGISPWWHALEASGSSLVTLGIFPLETLPQQLAAFSEAAAGLILVALLIAYLPTIYAAFARRETAVTLLEVRAGSPHSAVELIKRHQRIHGLERLHELWLNWEIWFADLQESHTSLAALVFFRSPDPRHSWVTASGAVLDAAALAVSTVDMPHDVQADLCLRAGYLALRAVADFFSFEYDVAPRPDDPISISREEYDAACEEMAAQGVPLKADRDRAWRDFSGWRVNYDTVLIGLAALTMAPYAPWSSDRSAVPRRRRLVQFKK